jgi:DNA-directed RNA polymerase subunit beta
MQAQLNLKNIRKSFSKIDHVLDIPNLIDIQIASYKKYLQADVDPAKRENVGLQSVFNLVFPITDFNNTCSLEFLRFNLDKPKYDIDECKIRGATYASSIHITVRLVVYDVDENNKASKNVRDIKEQDVYLGEIPLMTPTGSFVVNGTERVVVSQLHRSPGVFFDHDQGLSHSSGKIIYQARIIPYRGSWIDFEFDHKDLMYVRIDRRRKMHVTTLLRALGYDTAKILDTFYKTETITLGKKEEHEREIDLDLLVGLRATQDIFVPKSRTPLVTKNKKFTKLTLQKLKDAKVKKIPISGEELIGRVVFTDVVDPKTGEVILACNEELTKSILDQCEKSGVKNLVLLHTDKSSVGSYLRDTLVVDKIDTREDALLEIYRRLRPGDPPTMEAAETLFKNLFFNPARYDLSQVGRLKINRKFGFNNVDIKQTTLLEEDILAVIRRLIDIKNGRGSIDDIDHLGNRRVRSVGELVENQFRIGLVRMERAIKERMSLQEVDALMPHDLINAKPISAAIKEFFSSSQLSQFTDQTNPLSEVTHKRRLSALGPGGLTRERAGFEVRDVHATHYGRICPIETPEGPNIGLISSLSTFARVNEYGFVETPYRIAKNAKVTDEVVYYSAMDEEDQNIAQANAALDNKGGFTNDYVACRHGGEPLLSRREDVNLMDVSPNQLVSIAAALIPFLENDDANRALMGSNMQRQAVPLLRTRSPLVGTGIERLVARDSGACVVATRDGIVESIDGERIVVRVEKDRRKDEMTDSLCDIYRMVKFRRSNQNICINQKPIVKVGEKVKAGQVIADGPATENGELALGQNVIVAFMPWMGYNYEDSILISDRMVQDDVYTSIHVEEFECIARDTKLGREEITRDIPNVSEEILANLDPSGIIRIGAEVKPSDILVGKITPKGETQLSPEEKLLRAIFGEKAGEVRDTSLRVPPGIFGTVIDAKIFSREGPENDARLMQIVKEEEQALLKECSYELSIIKKTARSSLKDLLSGETSSGKLLSEDGSERLLKKGQSITNADIDTIPFELLEHIPLKADLEEKVHRLFQQVNKQMEFVQSLFQERIDKKYMMDELPPGVIKMVKVFVAIKRRISVGDKMAGRHGNKGVISQILAQEDMPFMADGKPVDIVLNPLGVPSRMNVGQILEAHLGIGAYGLGQKIQDMYESKGVEACRKFLTTTYIPDKGGEHVEKLIQKASKDEITALCKKLKGGVHMETPVFDRASEEEIFGILKSIDFPENGKIILFDGRTGESFDSEVTVGVLYMMKLHHLVDEKIHARSIGPYSLVTQQPLGGKAQFGGQRLGEMEVWALEAYGAAYCLQELLTVKSDDVAGRTRMYEAIVKGEHILEAGIPESFNVLVKELKSLCLDLELLEASDTSDEEGPQNNLVPPTVN